MKVQFDTTYLKKIDEIILLLKSSNTDTSLSHRISELKSAINFQAIENHLSQISSSLKTDNGDWFNNIITPIAAIVAVILTYMTWQQMRKQNDVILGETENSVFLKRVESHEERVNKSSGDEVAFTELKDLLAPQYFGLEFKSRDWYTVLKAVYIEWPKNPTCKKVHSYYDGLSRDEPTPADMEIYNKMLTAIDVMVLMATLYNKQYVYLANQIHASSLTYIQKEYLFDKLYSLLWKYLIASDSYYDAPSVSLNLPQGTLVKKTPEISYWRYNSITQKYSKRSLMSKYDFFYARNELLKIPFFKKKEEEEP